MLLDPISGMKLIRAKAGGGVFWYCPYSRGRMLTVYTAKHFFGEDATREIWVRSGISGVESEHRCPSCIEPMKKVNVPQWIPGGTEIDVCRKCHIIWVLPDEYSQVPHPEDLIVKEGDSTLVRDVGDAVISLEQVKYDNKKEESDYLGEGPEKMGRRIFAFLGLPAEMSEHGYPGKPFVSWIVMLACVVLFFKFTDAEVIKSFGLYPGDPFKNFGFNMISSTLLHGSVSHLIFNLYFFNLFADDLEENMGRLKYTLYLLVTPISISLLMFVITKGDSRVIPHIGLSGLIMAMMVYYGLQFPKSRFAYLVPILHSIDVGKGARVWVRGLRWLRIKVKWILLLYFLKDTLLHYLTKESVSPVSYRIHIVGALLGVVMWAIFSPKSNPEVDIDITGERDVSPPQINWFLKGK